MFTLKLFRRAQTQNGPSPLTTLLLEASRVDSSEMVYDVDGKTEAGKALILTVVGPESPFGVQYFVGEFPKALLASPECLIDQHGTGPSSLWGWGLLENMAGNTTQHFRPSSYG